MKKSLCVLLISLSLSSFADAQNRLFIFFINGVNVTADDADFNLSKLEELIQNDSQMITWDVLYSKSRGLWKSDIIDFMNQKRHERKKSSIDKYTNDYINKMDINCCSTSEEYNSIKVQLLQMYLKDKAYVGKNLIDIVNQFHSKVPKDWNNLYVLIIAHSQGNEYANELWDYLVNGEGFPRYQISIIGIASPANKSLDFGYYFTADNDKIINSARILPEKPMKANVHLEDCKEFTCHSLIDSYLNDKSVARKICESIKGFVSLWINDQSVC